jgi:primosomal protein N' (replication factor Y)
VPVPVRRLFTYGVSPAIGESLAVGSRVSVPFGPRKLTGTVVEWPTEPPEGQVDLKSIESVDGAARRLSPVLLELTRFLADYYLCSWGEAIEAALPAAAGSATERQVRRLEAADPESLSSRATARRALLDALPVDGTPRPVSDLPPGVRRAIPELAKLGWVEALTLPREAPAPAPVEGVPSRPPTPTDRQAQVLEELSAPLASREFAPALLFGATGSGKTEVYLSAAQKTLDAGRGVIYLVPEIGLTPLLLGKVSARFPGQVAVLHSGLSRTARYAAWQSVQSGARRLVIGTRSAIFAPVPDLGLIVVDEEQDGSYKQGETPRYNGRDLAMVRGRLEGAAVLLGSATPSMETFRHARAGRYRLLDLGPRIDSRPLPEVRFVDMRDELRREGRVIPVSRPLIHALRACVERGEQALVLRNRRGWAASVLCASCGERVSCGSCSIGMTWHRHDRRLRCHYCLHEDPYPAACPDCGAEELKLVGEGTERIESVIARAVPGARVERMDRDTTRRRGAQAEMLNRFDRGEIDILVGTQMIAKGHDFPRVTLVGVLSADHSLGLPDFRAGERTFQLLTQVAGRAGRGERPGCVLAQAFNPEHPVLRLAAAQDYEGFYDREIGYRRTLRYPPLTALVQMIVSDRDPGKAADWAATLTDELRDESGSRLLISGPGPHPIEKLKDRYRQQILVRSAGRRRLVQAVDRALAAVEGTVPRRAIRVDVDPHTLL